MKTIIKIFCTVLSIPLAVISRAYRVFHAVLTLAVMILVTVAVIQSEWKQAVFFAVIWLLSLAVMFVLMFMKELSREI